MTQTFEQTRQSGRYTQPKPKYDRKEWLLERYWGDLLSTTQVAACAGISQPQIRRYMAKHGVRTRHPNWEHEGDPLYGFREQSEDEGVDWSEVACDD